ncbi:sedoheptulose 7-phosphate cyclase [Terriglobus saanensis]|nr:sedoheptulose 7-phosphate cyclase [Terriglobus saanensis]
MQTSTLVIEQAASGWVAHRFGEDPVAMRGLDADALPQGLIEFASHVARRLGQSSAQCTMVVTHENSEAKPTRGSAGFIVPLTRTLALAYLAPANWDKFLVLEMGARPVASLAMRHDGSLREERLAGATLEELISLVKMLEVRFMLVHSTEPFVTTPDFFPETSGLQIESVHNAGAIVEGARRAATHFERGSGVWQVASGHTRMRANHTSSYDLYRPNLATFDLNEDTLERIVSSRPVFFVIDQVIEAMHGSAIRCYGRKRLNMIGEFVCAGTEAEKTVKMAEDICRAALSAGLRRDGLIVAVGGGVTLDVAGFAASILRRGVRYVRVPTTLIGLVDVSVGVKQAVNAFGTKNVLGSFYPPLACVLDYGFLKTLPACHIAAGFSEVIKMAILCDGPLFEEIERHGPTLTFSSFQEPKEVGMRIAETAELLMMQELAPNLFEDDLARRVDFGHTFSPVIEIDSDFRISHGEAVGLDMLLSTAIAANCGLCNSDVLDRLARLLDALSLPVWHEEMPSPSRLMIALSKARDHRGGALNLVVPRSAGSVAFLQDVSVEELVRACNDLQRFAITERLASPNPMERSDGPSLSI